MFVDSCSVDLEQEKFKDAAKARLVLVVPGCAFSGRDTHFRLSYAVEEKVLERGVEELVGLMGT